MAIDDPIEVALDRPLPSLIPTSRINPFSLLDLTFVEFSFMMLPILQLVNHPREVKDSNEPSGRAAHAPTIEDICGATQAHGSNANEML